MTDAPQLILHIGAPKCGSSALQSALSQTPEPVTATGRRLRYTAWRQIGRMGHVLYGADARMMGLRSAYGYANWPNIRAGDVDAPIFAGLARARRAGLRRGFVPVASSEGWIHRAHVFGIHLARWGYPPVEVVAFLRPVVDWTNAAFWQWGVWHVPTLDDWMRQAHMPYRFAQELEGWSRIPNVRLRFARARPDAVARFADWQQIALPPAPAHNASSSPALIGVLLRNRRLRPNGHEAAAEFVVQRWCPAVPGRRLWAVQARHVHMLRPAAEETLAVLTRLAGPEEIADLHGDARWFQEKPYHPEIVAGVSPLDDRAQMAALAQALAQGIAAATTAAGDAAPATLPACPGAAADLADWDRVLVELLDRLLAADARVRARAHMGQGVAGFKFRLGERLSGGLSRRLAQ